MRSLLLLKQDIIFQFRHRFYYAYIFILAVYYAIITNVEGMIKEFLTVFILFSDTTVLGFFFIGGIILLERDQNILQSLFVTPVKLKEYFFSKTASLTILAYLASFFIAFSSFGVPKDFFFFSTGVILSSTFFIFTGIAIAVRSKTVNRYFFNAIFFTMIFFIPLINLAGYAESDLFIVFPTYAAILLFETLFKEISFVAMCGSLLSLVVWNLFMLRLSYKWFYRFEILKNTKS